MEGIVHRRRVLEKLTIFVGLDVYKETITGALAEDSRTRAISDQKHDPGAPDVFLRVVPIHHDRAQADAAGGAYVYGDAGSHPPDSHPLKLVRILLSDSTVRFEPLCFRTDSHVSKTSSSCFTLTASLHGERK